MFINHPITCANAANLCIRSRRGLLHFELDNGIYFITFRLADSLPLEIIHALADERSRLIRLLCGARDPSPMELAEVSAVIGAKYDHHLDSGIGECFLRREGAARIVDSAIRYFDEQRYRLIGWCVMPNHAHVVMQLFRGAELERVLHSWKSYTANEVNELLGREGRLWQREYFDRIVRDLRELTNVVEYVARNPSEIGLTDWPFVGRREWWK